MKRECIPVGCVLAAHRPSAGVCFPWGGCLPGPGGGLPGPGGCLPGPGGGLPGPGGVCLVQGGVCLVPGGCLPGPGGVCLVPGDLPGPGGSTWFRGGGVSGLGEGGGWSGGVGIPACTEADTPPPCGQTHACKNITLATTSLRPVIN